jgi:hypothetical protein
MVANASDEMTRSGQKRKDAGMRCIGHDDSTEDSGWEGKVSYEQNCIDYALYGDPERDHWDHELNAQYDRFDGWGDPDPNDDPGCPTCGFNACCDECVASIARIAEMDREVREDCDNNDDVPF